MTPTKLPDWCSAGFLLQALVRPVAVTAPGVLGQDAVEVLLAEDQHVIQALAAHVLTNGSATSPAPTSPD